MIPNLQYSLIEIKLKLKLHYYRSVKIFREGANFVSLSKLLQSFAPRQEKALWPLIVLSNGNLRSVSDEINDRSLSSEYFMNCFLK